MLTSKIKKLLDEKITLYTNIKLNIKLDENYKNSLEDLLNKAIDNKDNYELINYLREYCKKKLMKLQT